MYSKETAREILRALYDWECSGVAGMPDAQNLAERLHVDLQDILDAFDILESDGYLKVYRVAGGGGGSTAQLSGRGKKLILQSDSDHSETKPTQQSANVTSQPRRVLPRASIFISHIHEEFGIALVLKKWIEKAFSERCEVFVSSDQDDIPAGIKWFDKIDQSLNEAGLFIILCSNESIARPWINFESGCAWNRQVPILPICHSGIALDSLPMPLSKFQGLDITDSQFLTKLLGSLAKHMGRDLVSTLNQEAFHKEISKALNETPKRQMTVSASTTALFERVSTSSPESFENLDEEETKILKTIVNKGDHGFTSVDLANILSTNKVRLDYWMEGLLSHGFLRGNTFTVAGRVYYLTQKARQYLFSHNLL